MIKRCNFVPAHTPLLPNFNLKLLCRAAKCCV